MRHDVARRCNAVQPFDLAVLAAHDEGRLRERVAHSFKSFAVALVDALLHGVEMFGEDAIEGQNSAVAILEAHDRLR